MKTPSTILDGDPVIGLSKRHVLAVAGTRGVRIRSRRGSVWVTQDGDLRDVVLAAGETLVVERDGALLVQALESAWVSVTEPAAAVRPRTGWWQRLIGASAQPLLGVPLRVSA